MEYQPYNSQNQHNSPGQYDNTRNNTPGGFTVASLTCSIISIVLCCSGVFSLIFGSLGILFAALSNRKGRPIHSMSIAGIATSVVGMMLGLFVSFYYLIVMMLPVLLRTPEYRDQLDAIYEQTYGMDLEGFLEHNYGMDLEEFLELYGTY